MLHLLEQYGLIALFVALTADSFAMPLPGETLLVAAAGMAGQGRMNLAEVIAVGAVAAAIGNGVGYEIGRRGGPATVNALGRTFRIDSARIERFRAMVERRGAWLVLVARFVPLLRETNGLVAGATGLERGRFWIANAAGAALWTAVIAGLAYEFGERVHWSQLIEGHVKLMAAMVLIGVAVAAVLSCVRSPRR